MEIKKSDLSLALYGEIVDQISRGDDTLVNTKISIGLGEVYGYLHRYDTVTMFDTDWEEDFLKALCINIISWHLISICSPNINMEIIRQNYDDAVQYLTKVQKGLIRPNWPLRPDDPTTNIDDAGNIQFTSNPKRKNHF